MKVNKRKVDTPDQMLPRLFFFYAAANTKTLEDQLRRTIRHLRTRVAKCT
jgi:hypothetical protein